MVVTDKYTYLKVLILKFSIIILYLLQSCNPNKTIIEDDLSAHDTIIKLFEKIQKSEIVYQYYGYYIKPRYQKCKGIDKIYIKYNDSTGFYCKNYKSTCGNCLDYEITPEPFSQIFYEIFGINNYNKYQEIKKTYEILKTIDELGLVGINPVQDNSFIKLYSKYKIIDSLGEQYTITLMYRYNADSSYLLQRDSSFFNMWHADINSKIDTLDSNWFAYYSKYYRDYYQLH